jgi:hypothetical protein
MSPPRARTGRSGARKHPGQPFLYTAGGGARQTRVCGNRPALREGVGPAGAEALREHIQENFRITDKLKRYILLFLLLLLQR